MSVERAQEIGGEDERARQHRGQEEIRRQLPRHLRRHLIYPSGDFVFRE